MVRLVEGNPLNQTHYASDAAAVAERWLEAGASWLHVVNLDGAFGESDAANRSALLAILRTAARCRASVQFGGGLRSSEAVQAVLELGVARAILGTLAVEQPSLVPELVRRWGQERIAVSLDVRHPLRAPEGAWGQVQVRGWREPTSLLASSVARDLKQNGLRWLIFTDISRDGLQAGLNLPATVELARSSGLEVIASGGVRDMDDIRGAQQAGLAGVIVGRALYEGAFDPVELFDTGGKDQTPC